MTDAAVDVVVFDVGGVLIDWDPEYLYRRLIPDESERRRFLTEVCSPEWNHQQDAGRPWAEAIEELVARFPHRAHLIAAYDDRWEEMVAGPIEGTVDVLKELLARGIRAYALTNFSADKWTVATQRWPFLQDFDGAVVSGAERVIKPDPRIYRILLERYSLTAERAFYVDDHPANVEQARKLGFYAELFTTPKQLRNQLTALGLI